MANEKGLVVASKMEQQRIIDALTMMETSQRRAAKAASIASIRDAFEREAKDTARLRDRIAQLELPL